MIKILVVATCLAVGAGAAAFAVPVSGEVSKQESSVQTSIALNRLAANRLAANRLAANGVSTEALSTAATSRGDVTPLVTIVAVTLADGTRMEMPALR